MAGGNKKIHKHPNAGKGGFQANPQNINRKGRPRKLISDVIKKLEGEGVKETSAEEIKSMYLRLMNFEISEIETVVKDNSSPALIRIVGKSILSGKGFDVLESMIDRAVGKALEKKDITTGGQKLNDGFKIEIVMPDEED